MEEARRLKLKVCGMRDAENIKALVSLKPDYIGFIFYAPSKRFAADLNREITSQIPSTIKKTGVFVNASRDEIINKVAAFDLDAVQLHGHETSEFCETLRDLDVEILKAFGIDETFEFDNLSSYLNSVDYFLFDTKTTLHGGSGVTFDWNVLHSYTFDKPYFLSGGLDSDNIPKAIEIEDDRFYGLDLNSRFEIQPGLKDIEKLESVIKELNISL